MKMKPLGAQLDGCRHALIRAPHRESKAREEVDRATAALADSSAVVAKLQQQQLATLEIHFAQTGTDDVTEPVATMNSIKKLAVALESVIKDMQSRKRLSTTPSHIWHP